MIRVDQPRDNDLVGNPILIAGIGSGFEAVINWRVSEGHDELTGFVTVGGGSGEHGQFQAQIDASEAAFKMDRLFVDVYEASAKDGSDLHKTTRKVLYGPAIIEGYYGYRRHTVKRGETLSEIARQHYGNADYEPIQRANPGIESASLIFTGQTLRVPMSYLGPG